jgi:uncharacterized protein YdaU (DUF1376 family)
MTQKNAKKTDAWMPLYIGDYLGATQRLTTEQHGAYLLLLIDYWRNGPPPNDDPVLAQITRLKASAWRKMKPVILGFFKDQEGRLIHSRAEVERLKAAEHQARRSEKAKKAADARWQQEVDAPSNAPSMPQAMLGGCPPPSPSISKEIAGKPRSIFDIGVEVLGGSPGSARSLIGKWRKAHGDAAVQAGLADAERMAISERRSWLIARFAKPANDAAALYASIDRTFAKQSSQESAK